ncbi:hypothetical protein [Pedobacter hartonius]|uniref:Tat (Twin-arginine translocation) pathway signal sequence n=1 Tax=Pedobacter hartonius TaxID=425514 RepID=A0A1H4H8S7_9SPHI|nr:hypothetical protein [Pedobacter hartonius]SEB18189.1 hypothetical protein SAMN05443550_11473 [Pedobacter hartonius]
MKTNNPYHRRAFLKTLSYGLGTLALSPALNSLAFCSARPTRKLVIALVGLGGYI